MLAAHPHSPGVFPREYARGAPELSALRPPRPAMNEADFPSINLDELRLVPDWLREGAPSPSKQYAAHEGPSERDERPFSRGPRPGGGGGGFNRDARSGGGPRRDGRRPGPGGGGGPRPGGGDRRDQRDRRGGPDQRPMRDQAPSPRPAPPVPVQVVFQPDDRCLASIIKQIRTTHLAYPLFSLARMFLQEPARHWVQFTVEPAAAQTGTALYQLGDEGPVTLDRAILERIAFDSSREQFYAQQTVQKEPLKGNFANVARERETGTLLGPTNYHGYQPALRALYETRFSRRMSFEDYRRGIQIVSDPALVEKWKEEARTTTTIVTKEGEPPTTLATPADARAHFRQHYFDGLVHSGNVRRVHGSVARNLPEAAMMQAIRQEHEKELRYPARFVQLLREGLQNAGLHIFKHRKRVVYVSLSRPTPFVPGDGAVSENVAAILEIIGKAPLCTRKVIAEHVFSRQKVATPSALAAEPTATESTTAETPAVLPADAPAEDAATKAKAALAADLRFLVQAGHIIEFHNGTFDLPLLPKVKEEVPTTKSIARSDAKPKSEAEDVGADPASVAMSSPASVPEDKTAPQEPGEFTTTPAEEPAHEETRASEVVEQPSAEESIEAPMVASESASEPAAVTADLPPTDERQAELPATSEPA